MKFSCILILEVAVKPRRYGHALFSINVDQQIKINQLVDLVDQPKQRRLSIYINDGEAIAKIRLCQP